MPGITFLICFSFLVLVESLIAVPSFMEEKRSEAQRYQMVLSLRQTPTVVEPWDFRRELEVNFGVDVDLPGLGWWPYRHTKVIFGLVDERTGADSQLWPHFWFRLWGARDSTNDDVSWDVPLVLKTDFHEEHRRLTGYVGSFEIHPSLGFFAFDRMLRYGVSMPITYLYYTYDTTKGGYWNPEWEGKVVFSLGYDLADDLEVTMRLDQSSVRLTNDRYVDDTYGVGLALVYRQERIDYAFEWSHRDKLVGDFGSYPRGRFTHGWLNLIAMTLSYDL